MDRGKGRSALAECRRLLAGFMEDFDPRDWPGHEAADLVRTFAELEKLSAAGKTLAAGRVEQTNGWKTGRHRSAEEWLARETGTSTASASRLMATASQVRDLPATEEAFRSGSLSADQAAEVASAASVDRAAERHLLEDAGRESLTMLRRRAQAVRHAARQASGEEELARIHRSRYLRSWTSSDGAVEGRFRLTPKLALTSSQPSPLTGSRSSPRPAPRACATAPTPTTPTRSSPWPAPPPPATATARRATALVR